MSTNEHLLKPPKVGDSIYVPPVLSREEPRKGGKAIVHTVEAGENGNGFTYYITVEQFPKRKYAYDWEKVSRVQELLRTKYQDTEARFLWGEEL